MKALPWGEAFVFLWFGSAGLKLRQ
jgi:hypothetical protein